MLDPAANEEVRREGVSPASIGGPAMQLAESDKLTQELAVFERHRGRWLVEHPGKFALIKGDEVVGIFDTAQNAYAEGASRFGNAPMLIKQITEKDLVGEFPALTLGLIGAHS